MVNPSPPLAHPKPALGLPVSRRMLMNLSISGHVTTTQRWVCSLGLDSLELLNRYHYTQANTHQLCSTEWS